MKRVYAALMAMIMMAVLLTVTGCSGSQAAKIEKVEDLANKRIGVQEGTTGDLLVTDEVEGAQISRFKSAVDAAMDLSNGKLDAVVIDEMPAKRIVEKDAKLKVLPEVLSVEEYAIAINKGNPQLVEDINAAIKAMKSDGTYDMLSDAYMPQDGKIKEKNIASEPSADKLIVGTSAGFEPFEYLGAGGEVMGFDIDMAAYIGNALGKEIVVEDMAFDSLIGALNSGKVDVVIAGMTVTEERKQNVDFSDPYFNAGQVIIVKK